NLDFDVAPILILGDAVRPASGPLPSAQVVDLTAYPASSRYVPLGNLNGDAFDDLGVEVLEQQSSSSVARQVAYVFLGNEENQFDQPQVVLEPVVPHQGTQEDLAYFYTALPFSLAGMTIAPAEGQQVGVPVLAIAESMGGGVGLFVGPSWLASSSSSTQKPSQSYTYELAPPLPPSTVNSSMSDYALFEITDNPLDLADVAILEGSTRRTTGPDHLGAHGFAETPTLNDFAGYPYSGQSVGDVNEDGIGDVLVWGEENYYLLFGPVDLDRIAAAERWADVIIDAEIGQPALRMGDFAGNTTNDLVFARTNLETEVFVLNGQREWPRHIAVPTTPFITTANALLQPSDTVSTMNWNGDAHPDLLLGTTVLVNPEPAFANYLKLTPEGTLSPETYEQFFGFQVPASAGRTNGSAYVTSATVGDVNGDGLGDVVVVDADTLSLDVNYKEYRLGGRAYLVFGSPLMGTNSYSTLSLSHADVVFQDQLVGGIPYALGDIDHDGYDDFALGDYDGGGARLFFGKAIWESHVTGTLGEPFYGDITLRRDGTKQRPLDFRYLGNIAITAGDFDGNGYVDLAVGDPSHRVVTPLDDPWTEVTLGGMSRGELRLLPDLLARVELEDRRTSRSLVLLPAEPAFVGVGGADRFGTLSATPFLDLNGDGIHDLLIGAPGAPGTLDGDDPGAGRVYLVYGAAASDPLTFDEFEILANRTVTGSGDFVVNRGDGRGFSENLTLASGESEQWFRFASLGDALPGNSLIIHSSAPDSYIHPLQSATLVPAGAESYDVYVASEALLVGDGFNDIVVRFDGQTFRDLPVFGDLRGFEPRDLAIGPDGLIYASDGDGNQIVRFDPVTGDSMGVFGDATIAVVPEMLNPQGIAFGPDGHLYVVGHDAQVILRFDGATGAMLPTPGNTGAVFSSSSVFQPQRIAFGADGLLYLTQGDNTYGEIFTYELATGERVGGFSEGLLNPQGIAVDRAGNLVVASSGAGNSGNLYRYRDINAGADQVDLVAWPADRTANGLTAVLSDTNLPHATDVMVGTNGDLFITSYSVGFVAGGIDPVIVREDAHGRFLETFTSLPSRPPEEQLSYPTSLVSYRAPVVVGGQDSRRGVMQFNLSGLVADRQRLADGTAAVSLSIAYQNATFAAGDLLIVELLNDEWSSSIAEDDGLAPGITVGEFTFTTASKASDELSVDITDAIAHAINAGRTRVTVRLQTPDSLQLQVGD
ncbi:MAG: FG-GAP repeat protein, partial [Planctomycetales bacterium]|nr:FG-GAP repeat protein [Planctomycetales bacterium]